MSQKLCNNRPTFAYKWGENMNIQTANILAINKVYCYNGCGQKFYGCCGPWLRSANNNNYYNANSLTSAGVNNNKIASESLLVRPALHSLAMYKRQTPEIFPYPTRTLTVGQK